MKTLRDTPYTIRPKPDELTIELGAYTLSIIVDDDGLLVSAHDLAAWRAWEADSVDDPPPAIRIFSVPHDLTATPVADLEGIDAALETVWSQLVAMRRPLNHDLLFVATSEALLAIGSLRYWVSQIGMAVEHAGESAEVGR